MSSSCESWTPAYSADASDEAIHSRRADQSRRQAVLENIIENKIIPRLLLAHQSDLLPYSQPADDAGVALLEHVDEFAEAVINRDVGVSIAFFEARRRQGATIEQLFQDLLAPTARRLGELWEEDINDFMDVTRGVAHLQQIVHQFSSAFRSESRNPLANRRALLMPLPGDNHSFGISLVGEHFRREGWRVWGGPPKTLDDILELVDGQWFDVVGLSASKVADPTRLAADILDIRRASLNAKVAVLIGGRVFRETPELAMQVGADATADDGRKAVVQAMKLIGPSERRVR